METRAPYILIGLFTLAGLLGLFGLVLWFANLQLDRQFAYYRVEFTSVAGLGEASDVLFAGFLVGRVIDMQLSPQGDGRVQVTVEVSADTPIRSDSRATVEAQGVTGVSYVGISPGTPASPLLAEISPGDVPQIEAGQSALQSLSQDAPEIVAETLGLVRDLRRMVGPDNRTRIQTILENAERSSAAFSRTLNDFSGISATVADFAREIDRFNTMMDGLSREATGAFDAAEVTLAEVASLAKEGRVVLSRGSETLVQAERAARLVGDYVTRDLRPATDQLSRSIAAIEGRVDALGDRTDGLIEIYSGAGTEATARLAQARQTLDAAGKLMEAARTTLGSMESTTRHVDTLLTRDAGPLVADLRGAAAAARSVLEQLDVTAGTDLPEIVGDLRDAAEVVTTTARSVGADLSGASGRIDGIARSTEETLASVRTTFEAAGETLAALNQALATGERALSAAEGAFAGADRIVSEEAAAVAAQLRGTLGELAGAVHGISEEIPGVIADLQAASRAAERSFARLDETVAQSAPPVRDFATTALPQYGRLAVEIRLLISSLEGLVRQIQRDPGRFILDSRAPEYRP